MGTCYSNNKKWPTTTKFYCCPCTPNSDIVPDLMGPEQFYEHYQELTPTKEKQKQQLEQLNIRLYQYCLIPSNFEYCNECDLIYNPLPHMIYIISEEKEPISSCTLE
ncbi:hypothetical protein G9A89_006087 [Geosiphon pyriformis]|nr:hypothetical protein G9A89_006087 [Geosiphon pyriformis]